MTKVTAAFRNFAKEPKNFQNQSLQAVRANVHCTVASTVMASRRSAGDYEHFEETCGLYYYYYYYYYPTFTNGGGRRRSCETSVSI